MEKKIEAVLFMASQPMGIKEISMAAGIGSLGQVRTVIENLNKEYQNHAFEIREENGKYKLQLKDGYEELVEKLSPYNMSKAVLETMALIAYYSPMKQSELIKIKGNKVYSYIKELENQGFISSEKQASTKLLKITRKFEKYFKLDKDNMKRMVVNEDKNQPQLEDSPKEDQNLKPTTYPNQPTHNSQEEEE